MDDMWRTSYMNRMYNVSEEEIDRFLAEYKKMIKEFGLFAKVPAAGKCEQSEYIPSEEDLIHFLQN